MGARGWVKGNGKLAFSGGRVSFWEVEKVLEMNSDDDCAKM